MNCKDGTSSSQGRGSGRNFWIRRGRGRRARKADQWRRRTPRILQSDREAEARLRGFRRLRIPYRPFVQLAAGRTLGPHDRERIRRRVLISVATPISTGRRVVGQVISGVPWQASHHKNTTPLSGNPGSRKGFRGSGRPRRGASPRSKFIPGLAPAVHDGGNGACRASGPVAAKRLS